MVPLRVKPMKNSLKSLFCLLLVVVMLVGCTPTSNHNEVIPTTNPTSSDSAPSTEPSTEVTEPSTEPTAPEYQRPSLEDRLESYAQLGSSPDDNYRTWYEIFVYSFCDSDGDGIGDLQGVISKLDYLADMGVTGIWLMPIHPSTSYHKYNVDDYYAIDRSYGTMNDLEQLTAECDQRGIKVIMDLVVNHSGNKNPWFIEAVNYLKSLGLGEEGWAEECKYFEYYNFVLSSTNPGTGYAKIPGTMYSYECGFSSDMPDLNWDCQEMRDEIEDIMRFWVGKGVGGFRIDAAKHFYNGNTSKNNEVLKWLQDTANEIEPGMYMVAEVFDSFGAVSQHYQSGFTSLFNFPFADYAGKLIKVVNGRGNPGMVTTWATALVTAHKTYSGYNPNYIDAPFLSNHDVGRIYSFVSGDPLRVKLAGAMNLFMSGSSFIYYGEEIGMPGEGNDPSKRAPMYWNSDRDDGTTKLPPGCVLPADGYPLGSLEEQMTDESSVYNYYREAIAIRNALPVIARGVPSVEEYLNVGCVSAVKKTWNDQQIIILMNVDTVEAKVDLSDYTDWELVAGLSADGNPIFMDGTELNLAAFGIAILRLPA